MNDQAHFVQQRTITHRIRDLSPGGLYDLLLAEAGILEFSPLFQQLAASEELALVADLVKLQTHFAEAAALFASSGGNVSDQASTLPQGQLLDRFLAATAFEREEQTFFDRFEPTQRAAFASTLLVIQAVLEDYRGLVSVALGGLQPPFAPGVFARHKARQAAGTVEGWDEQAGTVTLRIQPPGENAQATTATYPRGELIITGRSFPLPDAYWVGVRLDRLSPDQYRRLTDKAYEDHALWAYRWIHDGQGRRAFGLALVSRQHELASSQEAWVELSLASIRNRVRGASPLEVYCAPRAYHGPSFFTGGIRPLQDSAHPSTPGLVDEGDLPPDVRIVVGPHGLPELVDVGAVPAWIREANAPRREGEPALTPEELETVLAEARAEGRLFEIRQSCTVVSAEGELRDCYAEVVLRRVIHKVRSLAQWEELKAQAEHIKATVHPLFW